MIRCFLCRWIEIAARRFCPEITFNASMNIELDRLTEENERLWAIVSDREE